MSVKSPPLLMLSGAKVAMSMGPAHSSRCLISSQLRPSPPFVRISAHEPFSFTPWSCSLRSPFLSASLTSSTSGSQVPSSQSITMPAP